MGDQYDPVTGSIVFSTTDVSLPGNSKLPVEIRRSTTTAAANEAQVFLMADRDLQVPSIRMILPKSINWENKRCLNPDTVPPWGTVKDSPAPRGRRSQARIISPSAYFNGLQLNIPGQGSKTLLESYRQNGVPETHSDPRWAPFIWRERVIKGANDVSRATTDHWVQDSLGRRTYIYDWKRGTAQRLKRPDNTNDYRYVDNNG